MWGCAAENESRCVPECTCQVLSIKTAVPAQCFWGQVVATVLYYTCQRLCAMVPVCVNNVRQSCVLWFLYVSIMYITAVCYGSCMCQ